VSPWPHSVDGALLLTDLAETFARYAVLPPHAEIILALWIVMTYLYDAISVAPVLAITSPEKGCGKTTVLEIISPRAPCAIREQHLVGGAIPRGFIPAVDRGIQEASARGILAGFSIHRPGHRRRWCVGRGRSAVLVE